MAKFRKKPVVIDAVQVTADCADEACYWGDTFIEVDLTGRRDTFTPDLAQMVLWTDEEGYVTGGQIGTLEGPLHVSVGDWIITGVQGEKYPIKPDIFASTYEPVEE